MAYNNRENFVLNEEAIAAFLKDTLNRVENASEEEIKTLEQLKKLFKKNVPFSRRSFVAAYLIKNAAGNMRGGRFNRDRNDRFNRREDKNERFSRNNDRSDKSDKSEKTDRSEERPERAPRATIAPEAAGTIFVSVGRSRGVYPRDLVGLLVSVAGFDRSRIGEIKVLSNYSFVTLYSEDCGKAIAALNDYDYRGRKLQVSYSHQKDKSESPSDAPVSQPEAQTYAPAEDTIPANVTNDAHAIPTENAEAARIQAEQSAFAASMSQSPIVNEKPYSETTDDGQVKSHFGNGDAY